MDFSAKQFPKEEIIIAARWYLAYVLSYRNTEELIKDWNIGLDHSSVPRWVAEYGSWLQARVRKYYTNIKYCNNILEQDHCMVKTITDQMTGFKDFDSGIEAIAMLRKNQSVV